MTRRKPRTPEIVQVGPYTAEIRRVPGLGDDTGSAGLCNWDQSAERYLIQIDDKEKGVAEADVMIHEILEAINELRDLGLPHPAIQVLGTDLAQALYPNGLPPRRQSKKQ